jgi:ubiquitin C-terminal hydrolase
MLIHITKKVLDGENGYTCDKCKSRQPCHKKLTVHRMPEALVLHIKRFQFTAYSREKISTKVTFPVKGLNLAPFLSHSPAGVAGSPEGKAAAAAAAAVAVGSSSGRSGGGGCGGDGGGGCSGCGGCGGGDSAVYDLYGVSNHMGALGGGHYTAACLSPGSEESNQWYCFNDTNVTPIADERELQGSVAYVLFYRKQR